MPPSIPDLRDTANRPFGPTPEDGLERYSYVLLRQPVHRIPSEKGTRPLQQPKDTSHWLVEGPDTAGATLRPCFLPSSCWGQALALARAFGGSAAQQLFGGGAPLLVVTHGIGEPSDDTPDVCW